MAKRNNYNLPDFDKICGACFKEPKSESSPFCDKCAQRKQFLDEQWKTACDLYDAWGMH